MPHSIVKFLPPEVMMALFEPGQEISAAEEPDPEGVGDDPALDDTLLEGTQFEFW